MFSFAILCQDIPLNELALGEKKGFTVKQTDKEKRLNSCYLLSKSNLDYYG